MRSFNLIIWIYLNFYCVWFRITIALIKDFNYNYSILFMRSINLII